MIVHLGVVHHRRGLRRQRQLRAARPSSPWPRASRATRRRPHRHLRRHQRPSAADDSSASQAPASASTATGSTRPSLNQFADGQPADRQAVGAHHARRRRLPDAARPRPSRTATRSRIRVIVQPLVVWLWIGGAVMAFGIAPGRLPRPRAPAHRPGLGPPARPRPRAATAPAPRATRPSTHAGRRGRRRRRDRRRRRPRAGVPAPPADPPGPSDDGRAADGATVRPSPRGGRLPATSPSASAWCCSLFIGLLATRRAGDGPASAPTPSSARPRPSVDGHDPRRRDVRPRRLPGQVGGGELLRHLVRAVRRMEHPELVTLRRGARRRPAMPGRASVVYDDQAERRARRSSPRTAATGRWSSATTPARPRLRRHRRCPSRSWWRPTVRWSPSSPG